MRDLCLEVLVKHCKLGLCLGRRRGEFWCGDHIFFLEWTFCIFPENESISKSSQICRLIQIARIYSIYISPFIEDISICDFFFCQSDKFCSLPKISLWSIFYSSCIFLSSPSSDREWWGLFESSTYPLTGSSWSGNHSSYFILFLWAGPAHLLPSESLWKKGQLCSPHS